MESVVARVPAWQDRALTIQPLAGGVTNRNYVVDVSCGGDSGDSGDHGDESTGNDGSGGVTRERWVVRVPGERTELLGIDRSHEIEAATRAAELGIAPPLLGPLPDVGTPITRFIPGHHLEQAALAERLPDLVVMLKRFHGSGPLRGTFMVHRVVEWHAREAGANGVMPPSAYERLHQQSRRIEKAFGAAPTPPVPCHNDLLPANVLVADNADDDAHDGRLYLLDFEYAGMNDVFFDLANLSVNAELSEAADHDLLRLYFGSVTPARWARLQLMKVMSEFREGMWAVVQQAISTLDTDFVAYADERLASCEKLAARPEFTAWLEDAAHPVV